MENPAARSAAQEIAAGYATEGAALELGCVVVDGTVDSGARVRIPFATLNRHGLVAGATGTGKTKTLQGIAEQLSAAGVPVLLADVKGDLSGMVRPGERGSKIDVRARETGDEWAHGVPGRVPVARRRQLAGADPRHAHAVRPDPAEQGARPQRHTGVHARADLPLVGPARLPLLDIKDLRAVIQHLTSDEGKAELRGHRRGLAASALGREIIRGLFGTRRRR